MVKLSGRRHIYVTAHDFIWEEICISDSCPLTLPSQAQAQLSCVTGTGRGLQVPARCAQTRAASQGRAVHPLHQCSGKMDILEGATTCESQVMRKWGNPSHHAWSKSGCKLVLHILPSLDPDEEFKIFLCPELFLKLLLSAFLKMLRQMIKGKQQFLLYQEAQKMNVSLSLSL